MFYNRFHHSLANLKFISSYPVDVPGKHALKVFSHHPGASATIPGSAEVSQHFFNFRVPGMVLKVRNFGFWPCDHVSCEAMMEKK